MSTLRLSVIIVNWNSGALLRECVASIERETNATYEVLVVDNASTDGSANRIASDFRNATLVSAPENLGFAGGANYVLPRAVGEYIALLNPDTLVLDGALDRLVHFLEVHPGAGAVGPKLLHPSGRYRVLNGGWQPTIWSAFAHYSGLTRLLPALHGLHTTRDVAQRVGWLSGACLMVRRAASEAAGPLHEGWFMYAEDVEWCDRISRDWDLWYLPEAVVAHLDRQSTKRRGRAFATLWARGLHLHYVRRCRPNRVRLLAFDAILAAGLASRACVYAGRALVARKRDPWLAEAIDFLYGALELALLGLAGPGESRR